LFTDFNRKEDVSGIDVNCGCPKKFSIQGGMGAALLTNPDKLKAILTNLVENCGLPVTCKIRMLETKEETIKLCKMVETTGIKALAIHCRYVRLCQYFKSRTECQLELCVFCQ